MRGSQRRKCQASSFPHTHWIYASSPALCSVPHLESALLVFRPVFRQLGPPCLLSFSSFSTWIRVLLLIWFLSFCFSLALSNGCEICSLSWVTWAGLHLSRPPPVLLGSNDEGNRQGPAPTPRLVIVGRMWRESQETRNISPSPWRFTLFRFVKLFSAFASPYPHHPTTPTPPSCFSFLLSFDLSS